MTTLPASVRLALWATAAYAGEGSLPHAVAQAIPDIDHVVGDVKAVRTWHELGEKAVLVALTRAQDDVRVPTGSAEFTEAALAAGECVYVPTLGGALVPSWETFGPVGDTGHTLRWTLHECDPMPIEALEHLSLPTTEQQLRQAMSTADSQVSTLMLAERPSLVSLRQHRFRADHWWLPPHIPRRAGKLLELAATVRAIAETVLEHELPTETQERAARRALRELRHACDTAMMDAACVASMAMAGWRPDSSD